MDKDRNYVDEEHIMHCLDIASALSNALLFARSAFEAVKMIQDEADLLNNGMIDYELLLDERTRVCMVKEDHHYALELKERVYRYDEQMKGERK